MAQYPINDQPGIIEAVNYLASGPSGLGQDFQGFSSYTDAYLTGNFRKPFTDPNQAELYVAPIALSTSEMLDGYTWKFTFASAQPSPPFAQGNNIYVSGVSSTPAGYYDGTYSVIGVVSCSTTYVICRTVQSYTVIGPGSGGTIEYSNTGYRLSTDCNARVTVQGGQDRVVVGSQLLNDIGYTATTSSDLNYIVQINRYFGRLNNDPVNPDYLFYFDKTIFERTYTYTGLTGTASLPTVETIFASVIDQPTPGYYWYILEVEFDVTNSGDLQISENKLGLRSLTAQVVKP
jgi:hypothetical protein